MAHYVDPTVQALLTNIKNLTDNTGGTASVTLAAITAGAAYAQADMVAVKNAIASLAAIVNAIVNKDNATVHVPGQ
jgi:hypothetical protein